MKGITQISSVYAAIYFKLTLCIIAILTQIIGIYALAKMKKKTNQVMILINLTLSEMILLSTFLAMSIMGLLYYDNEYYQVADTFDQFRLLALPNMFVKVKQYVRNGIGIQVNLSLVFLTVDRFIHTVLPMRYALAAEDKKIFKKLIMGTWCLSVLYGLTVLQDLAISVYGNYVVTVTTVATIVLCYIFIIAAVQRSQRAARGNPRYLHRARRNRKHQLVPGI